MEENVFYIEETTNLPPGNGNNCNGHKNAIKAGGNGHWIGDILDIAKQIQEIESKRFDAPYYKGLPF